MAPALVNLALTDRFKEELLWPKWQTEQHHDSSLNQKLVGLTIVSQTIHLSRRQNSITTNLYLNFTLIKNTIVSFLFFYLPNPSTGKIHVLQSSIYWTTQQETESELIWYIIINIYIRISTTIAKTTCIP